MIEAPLGVSEELIEMVKREIVDHPHWCSEKCDNFNPEEYFRCRLINRMPRDTVMRVYHLCHDWR